MTGLLQDVRFAYRALWKHASLTVVAGACLALGIGANTTMYSTARALVFHPLPQLRAAERLVIVREMPRGADDDDHDAVSAAVGAEVRGEHALFDDATTIESTAASVSASGEAERLPAVRVTGSFFHVTGLAPALGTAFGDDAAAARQPVVVLGHALWTRRFGGDSAVVGRTILVDGEPRTVVGVMPRDVFFPEGAQLWLPLSLSPARAADRAARDYRLLARLAPGVPMDAAAAGVHALGMRIARAHPDVSAGWELTLEPVERYVTHGPRPFLVVELACVGFVLLIVCANVANLLLTRATGRRRELALRAALGAGRARLVRQLFVECLLLALVGGAAGTLLAAWGVDAVRANVPAEVRTVMAGYSDLRLDAHALAFTVLLSIGTALVFGLVPALDAARVRDVHSELRDGARGGVGRAAHRVRGALVVVQIALALMLLVGATLMARTFSALSERDPGFSTARLLTMRVTLPDRGYERPASQAEFFERLGERAGTSGGVRGAGVVSVLPLSFGDERIATVRAEEAPGTPAPERPRVSRRRVSTGYFAALGLPLRRGRTFTPDDDADRSPVAVVSASAARRYWGDADPIGRRLALGDSAREVTVVGVVGDARHNVLVSRDPSVAVYTPVRQAPARSLWLVVRTTSDAPETVAPAVRRAIAALDPGAATSDVFSMRHVAATGSSPQHYAATLLGLLAALAALLAALGIYGVMAYAVAQRTREIGVRIALGATPAGVLRLVAGSAGTLAAAGIGVGLLGAVGLARGLRTILWGTPAFAPLTFLALAGLLFAVALLAGLLPARRAARVDPVRALRAE